MGGEIAQRQEWRHDSSQDWHLLKFAPHKGVQSLVRDLNHLYAAEPAMHQLDNQPGGMEWIDCLDAPGHCFDSSCHDRPWIDCADVDGPGQQLRRNDGGQPAEDHGGLIDVVGGEHPARIDAASTTDRGLGRHRVHCDDVGVVHTADYERTDRDVAEQSAHPHCGYVPHVDLPGANHDLVVGRGLVGGAHHGHGVDARHHRFGYHRAEQRRADRHLAHDDRASGHQPSHDDVGPGDYRISSGHHHDRARLDFDHARTYDDRTEWNRHLGDGPGIDLDSFRKHGGRIDDHRPTCDHLRGDHVSADQHRIGHLYVRCGDDRAPVRALIVPGQNPPDPQPSVLTERPLRLASWDQWSVAHLATTPCGPMRPSAPA